MSDQNSPQTVHLLQQFKQGCVNLDQMIQEVEELNRLIKNSICQFILENSNFKINQLIIELDQGKVHCKKQNELYQKYFGEFPNDKINVIKSISNCHQIFIEVLHYRIIYILNQLLEDQINEIPISITYLHIKEKIQVFLIFNSYYNYLSRNSYITKQRMGNVKNKYELNHDIQNDDEIQGNMSMLDASAQSVLQSDLQQIANTDGCLLVKLKPNFEIFKQKQQTCVKNIQHFNQLLNLFHNNVMQCKKMQLFYNTVSPVLSIYRKMNKPLLNFNVKHEQEVDCIQILQLDILLSKIIKVNNTTNKVEQKKLDKMLKIPNCDLQEIEEEDECEDHVTIIEDLLNNDSSTKNQKTSCTRSIAKSLFKLACNNQQNDDYQIEYFIQDVQLTLKLLDEINKNLYANKDTQYCSIFGIQLIFKLFNQYTLQQLIDDYLVTMVNINLHEAAIAANFMIEQQFKFCQCWQKDFKQILVKPGRPYNKYIVVDDKNTMLNLQQVLYMYQNKTQLSKKMTKSKFQMIDIDSKGKQVTLIQNIILYFQQQK